MGTRRGGSFEESFGGAGAGGPLTQLMNKVDGNLGARIAVGTGLAAVGIVCPPLGTIITTYRLAKKTAEVVNAASEAYERTGDTKDAAKAAVWALAGVGVEGGRNVAISKAVDMAWDQAKTATGLPPSDSAQEQIVKEAAKTTISEVIEEWEKKP